jgi:hypothetical protein
LNLPTHLGHIFFGEPAGSSNGYLLLLAGGLVLGRDVPLEAVETLSLEKFFMKFASPEQMQRADEFQKRFWDVTLCLDEIGLESVGLNEAIPFAADVVQQWSKHCKLVYLTGRTENTRDITLNELRKFGFPTECAELVMFTLEDFARTRGLNPTGPTLADARVKRLSMICEKHNVVRAVDDYPATSQFTNNSTSLTG